MCTWSAFKYLGVYTKQIRWCSLLPWPWWKTSLKIFQRPTSQFTAWRSEGFCLSNAAVGLLYFSRCSSPQFVTLWACTPALVITWRTWQVCKWNCSFFPFKSLQLHHCHSLPGGEKTKDRKPIPLSLYPLSLLWTHRAQIRLFRFTSHSQITTEFVLSFCQFRCFFSFVRFLKKELKGNLRYSQSKLGLIEAQPFTFHNFPCSVSAITCEEPALLCTPGQRNSVTTRFHPTIPPTAPALGPWIHFKGSEFVPRSWLFPPL